MACKAEELRQIPLFALLDGEEIAVLAAQVQIKKFAPRQRIYKLGEACKHAYVMMSGVVG
jgi:CRP/FNR family cyclic AMP-dependent transcriptional regulator